MTVHYILDTDHVSLFQRRHPHVLARVATMSATDMAVSIITVDEQLHGRLAVIRPARTQADAARGYQHLQEALEFYASVLVVPYDAAAVTLFETLRRQGVRIGTQDLRIAAIALARGASVVTRNARDFQLVPGLPIEDWSNPAGSS